MLPELTNTCKEFLLYKVEHDISACISVYRVATALSQDDVCNEAWKVMLENFQLVAKTDSVKEMSENEVLKYIGDKGLNVVNEDPVFEAMVAWVRHDFQDRKSRFESLMENITLSHCSYTFLANVVRKEPLMKNMTCLDRLAEALSSYSSLCSEQLGAARKGLSDYSLIAIYDDRYWKMKPVESDWVSDRLHITRKLKNSRTCLAEDGILITGGFPGALKCWKLSLLVLDEIEMSDRNVARHSHASVSAGKKVYVLGGRGWSHRVLKSVECLEPKTETWQTLHDMMLPLCNHTAVKYNDLIYVLGGLSVPVACPVGLFGEAFTDRPVLTTLQLDTQSGIWSQKADMPQAYVRGSSVVYRGRICVLGGDSNCCMSYDPHQDKWKVHSQPATNHDGGSAVVWKDRILLCGGTDSSMIEEYSPDTDTWSEWKYKLPEKGGNPAVFAVHL